jgi:hypothetical protein
MASIQSEFRPDTAFVSILQERRPNAHNNCSRRQ